MYTWPPRVSTYVGYLCGNTKVYFKGCGEGHDVMLSALHAANSVELGQSRQSISTKMAPGTHFS